MTPTTYGYDTAYCLKSHYGVRGVVGRSWHFCLNLYDNSVMRGRVHARRTLKGLVADLRLKRSEGRNSFAGAIHGRSKELLRSYACGVADG